MRDTCNGKTHLATVLGMEAYLSGKSVLFTNIPNLVIELKESMSANQLHFYKRRFGKYDWLFWMNLITYHLIKLERDPF